MRTWLTLIIMIVLVPATSAPAAEQRRESFADAANRAGRELAGSQPAPPAGIQLDWRPVLRLPPASEIRVTLRDGRITQGRLGEATDDRLILLLGSAMDREAARTLLDMARYHPGYLGLEQGFVYRKITVNATGVYFDGVRLGDRDAVIATLKRDQIAFIELPVRGSLRGAAIGAAAGLALGYLTYVGQMFKQCGASCSDERFLAPFGLIAMPVVGSIIGSRAVPHPDWRRIYGPR